MSKQDWQKVLHLVKNENFQAFIEKEQESQDPENVTPTIVSHEEQSHNRFLDRLLSQDERDYIRRKSSNIKVLIQRQKSFDIPYLESP